MSKNESTGEGFGPEEIETLPTAGAAWEFMRLCDARGDRAGFPSLQAPYTVRFRRKIGPTLQAIEITSGSARLAEDFGAHLARTLLDDGASVQIPVCADRASSGLWAFRVAFDPETSPVIPRLALRALLERIAARGLEDRITAQLV